MGGREAKGVIHVRALIVEVSTVQRFKIQAVDGGTWVRSGDIGRKGKCIIAINIYGAEYVHVIFIFLTFNSMCRV